MQTIDEATATVWPTDEAMDVNVPLVVEEPLTIRIQGANFAVILRTPGDDSAHAAGFCLAEGIIDSFEDIANIACCDDGDQNVVTVTLTDQGRRRAVPLLDRGGHISQTSCGWCGRQMVDDLMHRMAPIPVAESMAAEAVRRALLGFHAYQPLRSTTRATHGAILLDRAMMPLAWDEDVGRHNALDKAIGRLLLDDRLSEAVMAAMSSRISYELVQKAAAARIPVLFGVSRPTQLAVRMADATGITLGCLAPEDRLWIFTHPSRIDGNQED